MKFIADAMLGSLAKWLRLLGLDTLYFPHIKDSRLIRISKEEKRHILTKDSHFRDMKDFNSYLFLHSDNLEGQLKEILRAYNFKAFDRSRCANCNGEIIDIKDREEVRRFVPDYVFQNFASFSRCCVCGNIYWEGSHKKKIDEMIEKLKCR